VSEKSIPAQDIIDECKKRGYLAKQLYVVFTTPTNGIGPVMENLAEHLKFQESLENDGVVFAAGPHWTDDEREWDGEGMVVIRAESLEHAKQIADKDPMHQSGARTYRVRPWLVNEGTVTIELSFATKRFMLK
jgi:hypothetical protein